MIVVNHTLRTAYIAIPKAASTAIRKAVAGVHMDHVPAGYFTFTFVRHPFDRLVSAVSHNLRSLGPMDERIEQHMQGGINSHIRPQVTFLEGVPLDFLGYFETLMEDWKRLQQLVALPDLTHENKGRHRPADWRDAPIDFPRWRDMYTEDWKLCPAWN